MTALTMPESRAARQGGSPATATTPGAAAWHLARGPLKWVFGRSSRMAKIDTEAAATVTGSRYPAPYDRAVAQRQRRRLGDLAGLSHFGVNLTRLPAGTWSSQRHWHSGEDEFVYVLEGELV